MKIQLSLKKKIFFAFFFTCLLTFLFIWLPFQYHFRNYKFSEIEKQYISELKHLDFAIANHFKNVENILRVLISNQYVRIKEDSNFTNFLNAEEKSFTYNYSTPEENIISIFKSIHDNFRYINSIYMGRENGSFVRSYPRAQPTQYDPRNRPWYKLSRINPDVILRTPAYSSVTTDDINIGTVGALTDITGFYGVVGIDVTINNLTDYFKNVNIGNEGYILLIDEYGYILTSQYNNIIMKNVNELNLDFFHTILRNNFGSIKGHINNNEYYLFHKTSDLNWKICAVLPVQEIYSEINTFLIKILTLIFSALLIIALLNLFTFDLIIIKPIIALKNATDKIAETNDFNLTDNLSFNDEIGNLAAAFSNMVYSISKTNNSLIHSEKKYRSIFENALEGIFQADENGYIKKYNNSFAKITGIDINYSDTINLSDFIINQSIFEQIINLNSNSTFKQIETEFKSKSGKIKFIKMSLYYSIDNLTGKKIIDGILVDLTDRKAKEDFLNNQKRDLENKYYHLIESMGESFLIIDQSFNVIYGNQRFYNLFDFNINKKTNIQLTSYISEKELCSLKTILREWDTSISINPIECEIEWTRFDNTKFQTLISINKFYDINNQKNHYAIIMTDISKLKSIEKELLKSKKISENANKEKSKFLANMSHEIRTPMNAILGMLHLCLETNLSDKQKNYLLKMQNASKTLLRLLNDILDISKIESGKLTIEKTEFNIHEILNNIFTLLELETKSKGLDFIIDIPPDIPTLLIGDSLRLEQIILNLANNAVKFTHKGKIIISVSRKKRLANKITLLFSVSDSGIGMTPEQSKKIFAPFMQAETSTTRSYGGTGLGLIISKRLVELMNGKIWVNSELNKGSIFSFTAEFEISKTSNLREQNSNNTFLKRDNKKEYSILLVEDNEINRLIISELLLNTKYKPVTVNNGYEAIDISNKQQFDCILMDLNMPDLDGYETTKRIRKISSYSNTPIIALTANVIDSEKEKCFQAGMNDFLSKPFEPKKLFELLTKYC